MPVQARTLQFRDIADDPHDGVLTILPVKRFFPTYPSKCHCLWYKPFPVIPSACGPKSLNKHHHSWWCPCWICRAACLIQRYQRKRIAPATASNGTLLRETSACFKFVREVKGVLHRGKPPCPLGIPLQETVLGYTSNAVCPRKLAHRRAGIAVLNGNRRDSARVWNCQWHFSVLSELRVLRAYYIILQNWRRYLVAIAKQFIPEQKLALVALHERARDGRRTTECPARRCDLLARAAACHIIAAFRLKRLLGTGVPWNFGYATAADCLGSTRLTVLVWRTAVNKPGCQWAWFPPEPVAQQVPIDAGLPRAGPPPSIASYREPLTTYCPRRALPSACYPR